MLDTIPSPEEMTSLLGESRYKIWNQLNTRIQENYDMDRTWNTGGKAWTYGAARRYAHSMQEKTA